MRNFKIAFITFAVAGVLIAQTPGVAQQSSTGSGGGIPETPEKIAKRAAAHELSSSAKRLFEEAKWAESVAKTNESLPLYEQLDEPPGTFVYWTLAKAQQKLGNFPAASEAYRQMTRRVSVRHPDLGGDIGSDFPDRTKVDYIRFLATQGREADAKAVYYSLMRQSIISYPEIEKMNEEPFPVLIVFDQDANGDYWEYTPERIILASQLVAWKKSGGKFYLSKGERPETNDVDHPMERIELAKSLFPGSYLPYAYAALGETRELNEAKLNHALTLAKNQRERDYIEKARTWFKADYFDRREPDFPTMTDASAERKKITLLETARLALVQDHSSVSCGKIYGKGF